MKVTLDTNVIISGTFWTGDSYRVLEAINNFGIELVISREILDEYLDVIDREEIIEKLHNPDYMQLADDVRPFLLNAADADRITLFPDFLRQKWVDEMER